MAEARVLNTKAVLYLPVRNSLTHPIKSRGVLDHIAVVWLVVERL